MKYISIVFQFQPAFIFYNKVKPEYLIKCHGIVKFCKSFVMTKYIKTTFAKAWVVKGRKGVKEN